MKPYLAYAAFVLLLPALPSEAQHRPKAKNIPQHHPAATTPKPAPPAWSLSQGYTGNEHVYFQDYYTFYDPTRGYIYWSNGGWKSSPVPPSFLSKVDLGKAKIQILKGLSLDLHPERNYPNYMKLYPASGNNADVPVPGVTK